MDRPLISIRIGPAGRRWGLVGLALLWEWRAGKFHLIVGPVGVVVGIFCHA